MGKTEKSLYGLRDAPQIWKRHLVATLKGLGFEESSTVPGLLHNRPTGVKIAEHVDDRLITGENDNLRRWKRHCEGTTN